MAVKQCHGDRRKSIFADTIDVYATFDEFLNDAGKIVLNCMVEKINGKCRDNFGIFVNNPFEKLNVVLEDLL